MLDVLLVVAVNAAIFLVVGAPLAALVRGKSGGWGWLAVDSLAFGAVGATLAVTLYAWIGWAGPTFVALAWVAAIVMAFVTKVGFPARPAVRGRDWWLVGGYVLVTAGSLALRLREVNFIQWVGDMGAYVNWANEFVLTGVLRASWPPFFSSYLTISTAIFGSANTTAAVPLAGMLFVLVVARVSRQLGAGKWAALVTAALAGLSVEAIWYSSFPGSEALNAPLFVVWVGTVVGSINADRRTLPAWLTASGMLMVALGLLRGTGPLLLLPLLILAILAIVIRRWRPMSVRLWLVFSASLLGAIVTYWYGIQRIPHYYITTQVHDLLPNSVYLALGRVGMYDPTVRTFAVLIVGSGILCAVGLWLARRYSTRVGHSTAPRVLAIILASGLALGVVADAVVNAEVWNILLRAGLWLAIAAILTILLAGRASVPPQLTALVLMLGTTAGIFIAIHSLRLKVKRGHAFYLYWDRYLVSEVIPILFLLLAIGLTLAWQWRAGAIAKSLLEPEASAAKKAVPIGVAVILLAGAILPTAGALALVERHAYMNGAYRFQLELNRLVPDRTAPILWSANSTGQAAGYFFPNTWMAFAKPMQRSFGYDVLALGVAGSDFSPDVVYSADSLAKDVVCLAKGTAIVFETDLGGPPLNQRITGAEFAITRLGSATSDISLLSEPPVNGGWTHAAISVTAWKVVVTPDPAHAIACAP